MTDTEPLRAMIRAGKHLRREAARLLFASPVACVYHPLDYAWPVYENYLKRYATTRKRVLFLGMNPGPFGMVQTGIPFGEVRAVRDWLGIAAPVAPPKCSHPKRPVLGFDCPRSEVSGRRLWGLFAERFGNAPNFFRDYFVLNYCPLAFVEATGANRTPDKLPRAEREALFSICDDHLRAVVSALVPDWLIGIGDFAAKRAAEVLPDRSAQVGRILHPSPASPAANRDWSGMATAQLRRLGIWD